MEVDATVLSEGYVLGKVRTVRDLVSVEEVQGEVLEGSSEWVVLEELGDGEVIVCEVGDVEPGHHYTVLIAYWCVM